MDTIMDNENLYEKTNMIPPRIYNQMMKADAPEEMVDLMAMRVDYAWFHGPT